MDVSEFAKMDIFFLVTTLVVLLVGVLFSVVLTYLIRILRDISEITGTVRREADGIADDISAMRTEIKEGVEDVKEHVEDGLKAAKTYSRAVAGAGIVRALAVVFQGFADERERSTKRGRRSKRSER